MQASERHGFEGEGFSYLKSPIWWSGVITCTVPSMHRCCVLADSTSGCRGSLEFRRVCFCAGDSGDAAWCAERFDRVGLRCPGCDTWLIMQGRPRILFSTREIGHIRETGLRNVSAWVRCYCPACAAG